MKPPFTFGYDFERIMRYREQVFACERAARLVARFCAAADVEAYVRTCARAERHERAADALVNAISLFVPTALVFAIDGAWGFVAGMLFVSAWAFVGLDQCMTHKARIRAATVAAACAALCEVAQHADAAAVRGYVMRFDRQGGRDE